MYRYSLVALLGSAGPTFAQGIRDTTPTPQYRPAGPMVSPVRPGFGWPFPSAPVRPWVWPGYYPYYAPYSVWGWGLNDPARSYVGPIQPPPLQGAGGGRSTVAQNLELTAELTLEFPADAAVTANGQSVAGSGRTRTLASPPLKAGETHTFDVKAAWTADGKNYEWERVVTLNPGQRSKVTIARGFLVKD